MNIQPDDPTAEQAEFINRQLSIQENLNKDLTEFLDSLNQCEQIEDVKKIYQQVGISLQIPSTIEDFQDLLDLPCYSRQLIQNYYYCVGRNHAMNEDQINNLLRSRQETREQNIDECLDFIVNHIEQCKEMELDEVKAYLANLHIHLEEIEISDNEEIPFPPTNRLEWEQCILSEEFQRAIAGKWLDFQETTLQLGLHMLRQAITSKHGVERKFLNFQQTSALIEMSCSVLQLLLCMPHAKAFSFIQGFFTNFSKLGIPSIGIVYVFCPLYPALHFRLEAIFLTISEHFFGIKYLPNEYSSESYQLNLHKQMTELIFSGYQLALYAKQTLLWLNIRLVENSVMGLEKKPFNEDARNIQMLNDYEQVRLDLKKKIMEINDSLKQLRIKDVKLIINPNMLKVGIDPIEEIADILQEVDFDYMPIRVKEFFEDHLGFELNNSNKHLLKEELEDFFSTRKSDFIDACDMNRSAYLRA